MTTYSQIKVIRRDETTLRLGGSGDNWHMTWAHDDKLYAALCDGAGWGDNPTKMYNSRLFTCEGDPPNAKFTPVSGYPELLSIANTRDSMRYYGFGTLALDGKIFQFMSTPNHQFFYPDGERSAWPDARFDGVKLIYSPDDGRTWCNQNGSTRVVWEPWGARSRENMLFFEESQGAFSILSVLQMGRNYSSNKDGYVYVYAPNGYVDGTMNELVLFRVPKAQILSRSSYEYFQGRNESGDATWARNIESRKPVHTFPRGWVNTTFHPWAWVPSITYNEPLGLYMMANWGIGPAPDGLWFGKPSYLGIWTAKTPWGPWEQVHEESVWTPAHDANARAFAPQISPKWIAKDGKSFWLVWSDFQIGVSSEEAAKVQEELNRADDAQRMAVQARLMPKLRPYYAFNAQRVDLNSV